MTQIKPEYVLLSKNIELILDHRLIFHVTESSIRDLQPKKKEHRTNGTLKQKIRKKMKIKTISFVPLQYRLSFQAALRLRFHSDHPV